MFIIVVSQDPMRIPFWVIELPTAQHPPECRQAHAAQKQRNRDQYAKHIHQRSRNAFNETVKDDEDIAKAAIKGEHNPATANGTASRL